MPDDYDHISYIYRPREFARALGSMVAEQLGPQGREEEMKHTFDGELKLRMRQKTQLIVHGPVVYVENPFETISKASDKMEYMLLRTFTKGMEYRDQREYRFVVWTEKEPEDATKDLNVSLAMLGAMERRSGECAKQGFPRIIWSGDTPDSDTMTIGQYDRPVAEEQERETDLPLSLLLRPPQTDLGDDNSIPVAPYHYNVTELPEDLEEVTTTYSAVRALRHAIGGPFGRRNVEAASSAWHIEPCIRRLCSLFDDPIRNIRVTEDNFVVVTLNFPEESKAEGKIAVGPLGTRTYQIKRDKKKTFSIDQDAWWLGDGIQKILEEAGLHVRQKSTVSPSKSLTESG